MLSGGGVGAEGVCIQYLARVTDMCVTVKEAKEEEKEEMIGRQLEPPSAGCLLGSVHTAGLHARLLITPHI